MPLFRRKREASPEKVREREIEEERERERELERRTSQGDDSTTEVINHFTHPHTLIYTEPDYKTFQCNSCSDKGKGKRYHCSECSFDMHKICARSPVVWLLHQMPPEDIQRLGMFGGVINTFAHTQHSVTAEYQQKLFRCDHCKNNGDGLRYKCDVCDVAFHQLCAEHPTRLNSHLHPQHELELKLRPRSKPCEQCATKGNQKNNRIYTCNECEFYIHPECSQLPLYLLHPLHPPHPLLLKRSCRDYHCSACSKWRTYGFKYTCTRCRLDFDHTCIMQTSKLGLNDELRQNSTAHEITILPVANLTFSFAPAVDPPTGTSSTSNTTGELFQLTSNILEAFSEP